MKDKQKCRTRHKLDAVLCIDTFPYRLFNLPAPVSCEHNNICIIFENMLPSEIWSISCVMNPKNNNDV